MSWRTALACVGFAAAASLLVAQDTTTYSKKTTTQNPDGSMTTTTVTGEVVRYEAGRTIVIRQPDNTEMTYTLTPSLTVPADVAVGRRVTITTEPGDGSLRVQRITTVTSTTSPPEPQAVSSEKTMTTEQSTQTQETRSAAEASQTGNPTGQTTVQSQTSRTTEVQPSGANVTTTSKVTTISGTVSAYEPGQSITVVGPNHKSTTYTITQESQLPQDVTVGKKVTVQTTTVSGKPVVRSVTTKTTTKTTHTKTVSPQ